MDLGQQIAVYLGVLLLIWYVVAAMYNRRRGISIYRWLQPGIATQGEISEAKWIGSSGSGARITVARANPPFRRIEAAYLLQTRELLPLWLFNWLRGRRDLLILRVGLRTAPTAELETMHANDRRLQGVVNHAGQPVAPEPSDGLAADFQVAWRGRRGERQLDKYLPFLAEHSSAVRRLSLSRKSPHLILELNVSRLLDTPASEIFASLVRSLQGNEEPGGEQQSSS